MTDEELIRAALVEAAEAGSALAASVLDEIEDREIRLHDLAAIRTALGTTIDSVLQGRESREV